jgi:hypothetical protein
MVLLWREACSLAERFDPADVEALLAMSRAAASGSG